MKGGKSRPSQIWVEGIIRKRDIRGNVAPEFIELCMDELQHSGRKPTELNICYRVLLQKSEFTPRGTHKH